MKYIDIVLVKDQVASGKLCTKIDMFDNILLEDTIAGEAVKIGKLPGGYSFHEKGTWEPIFIYSSRGMDNPMEGQEGWVCSECGWTTTEKYDWCTCGTDMRKL